MYDRAPYAMFWRQNATTSLLLGRKQMDLGNGGDGLPGSPSKMKRLEILATKRNSSSEREPTDAIRQQIKTYSLHGLFETRILPGLQTAPMSWTPHQVPLR